MFRCSECGRSMKGEIQGRTWSEAKSSLRDLEENIRKLKREADDRKDKKALEKAQERLLSVERAFAEIGA